MVTVPRLVRVPAVNGAGEPIVCDFELRGTNDTAPHVLILVGDATIALDLGDLIETVQLLETLAARGEYHALSRIGQEGTR